MKVELYVYDLSKGLARAMSLQWLGIQIDAVYHTSLVLGGMEYFYGAGVQTCRAGTTHHGRPMEVIHMGETDLPLEVILEYLESLKEVYTAEAYDLFVHNCNNFTNDFAMFLVGKGIPDHITSLPQTVLNTPFGQMLRPALDSAMRPITQAPVPQQQQHPIRPTNNAREAIREVAQAQMQAKPVPKVHNVTSLSQITSLLQSASTSSAIIFFTSSTCAPCKLVYQPYDDLAAEAGDKCVFIKVDLNGASADVGSRFPVRATPTFMTFLKGQKHNEWSGADARQLKNNVQSLLEAAFPAHPHLERSVPTLLKTSLRPVTYAKMPPLDKLVAKMGEGQSKDTAVKNIVAFVKARESEGAREAPLPDMPAFAAFLRRSTEELPPDLLFTSLDLLRVALVDPRVSGYFAEEHSSNNTQNRKPGGGPDGDGSSSPTISHLLSHVLKLGTAAPYNLRLTALHMACNLFTSPLFVPHLLSPLLSSTLIGMITSALLDDKHVPLQISALSLALNMTGANHKIRMKKHSKNQYVDPAFSNTGISDHTGAEELPEAEQTELLASLLEVLGLEDEGVSDEVKKMAVVCTGWLLYCVDENGEVRDLGRVMDARSTIERVSFKRVEEKMLGKEVSGLVE